LESHEKDETPKERADRELIELLNELRVVLPGVTVLLAFLLAVPFANGWDRVTPFQRDVFIVAFLAAALSVVVLTAPSSLHRLRFRQGDKTEVVKLGNALTIAGIAISAVALGAVVLLVIDSVASLTAAVAATSVLLVVLAALWYGLPLAVAMRERRAR
jgi:amino acid transporter